MVTPERWQRIKDLFNSALDRPAAEREHYLSEACSDDQSIREEVESLLSAHDEDPGFLNAPAYEIASDMLEESGSELTAGDHIGPYTILSSVGFGGMGEVYLAHDSRLGRKIAIKLLAPKFASDELRVQRFEMEARAASALNHPNVCVIHDVGRAENGRHYMAMEYVEGTTLRQRMNTSRLSLKQALDVAAQVAWALEAAHAAGIVHRDIKPENIMLRPDGYVKVLDFGIAKLNAYPPIRDVRPVPTVNRSQTAPGTLMGTVKYMSPEQLRELPIDPRSDIWSLGVVLHEMVTGNAPFEAATTSETITVILERKPPRLDYPDRVPEDVREVISKALNKRRGGRYQTMHEFAVALRNLRRHVSAEVVSELLAQPTLDYATSPVGELRAADIAPVSTIFSKIRSQAVSTAAFLFSEIKEHKRAAVFTGATAIFALLFFSLSPISFFKNTEPNTASPQSQTTIKPMTNAGQSVCAAISPDGRYVAHAAMKEGMQELLITRTANLATSTVVPRSDVSYRALTFSPDGDYLYFTRLEKSENVLYQLALPGSAPRKLKSGVDSPITFSPDGDRFAFVRFDRNSGEYFLIVDDINGSAERTIATRRDGNRFAVGGPSWSPDGKTIACGSGWWDKGFHMNLVEIDVESGQEKPIKGREWFSVQQVIWQPDKRGLIISVREQPLSPPQIWRISYPEGDSARLTTDTTEYQSLSLSRDGNAIVAIQTTQNARIWISSEGDDANVKTIASTVGLAFGLSWAKHGIIFSSMAGDNLNIWRIDADGSNQTQLTVNAGDNYTPATSIDGRFIVFSSNRNGSFNIWRMGPDGADPQQLTFDDGNFYPSVSSDNQWFAYDNQSRNPRTIWKAPLDGGTPVQLTDEYARMPVFSPDNQFIACRYHVEPGLLGIAILPFEGGKPVKLLRIPVRDWQRVQWIENGRALSYIDVVDGVSNIWSYDLASGATKQLTHFKSDQIFAYAWSPDFKQLATQRGTTVSDVTIINYMK